MNPLALLALVLGLAARPLPAAEPPSGTVIVEKSQLAFYYPGTDMKARVTMDLIAPAGGARRRVLTMLRKNAPSGKDQKYFLYFHEPGDVRRTAFLVWKCPGRDSDRWIFIPAVNMVRRIAARDSQSSFVGSDFSYEDVSGRALTADTHSLVREEKLGASDCYVVQGVPRSASDYTRKLSWVDKKTFLPLKEEWYDAQDELDRVFTADAVEEIAAGQGSSAKSYPTVTRRTMKNVKSGHKTEVTFENISYDMGIDEAVFSERSLETPPPKWVR